MNALLVGCRVAADTNEGLGGGGVGLAKRLAQRERCQYRNSKKFKECNVARMRRKPSGAGKLFYVSLPRSGC